MLLKYNNDGKMLFYLTWSMFFVKENVKGWFIKVMLLLLIPDKGKVGWEMKLQNFSHWKVINGEV